MFAGRIFETAALKHVLIFMIKYTVQWLEENSLNLNLNN